MSSATLEAFADLLGDLDPDDVLAAVRRHAMTEEFPPSVAAIRRRIAERRLALPAVAEAVEALGRPAAEGESARASMHPLVWQARAAVGDGWAWRTTENPSILVAQARKVYEELREATLRAEIVGLNP